MIDVNGNRCSTSRSHETILLLVASGVLQEMNAQGFVQGRQRDTPVLGQRRRKEMPCEKIGRGDPGRCTPRFLNQHGSENSTDQRLFRYWFAQGLANKYKDGVHTKETCFFLLAMRFSYLGGTRDQFSNLFGIPEQSQGS